MVNNFTNINKANNHLAHQIIELKKVTIYDVVNQILGQVHKCGSVDPLYCAIRGESKARIDSIYGCFF